MQPRGGRKGTYVHTRSGLEQKSRMTVYVLLVTFSVLGIIWFVFVSHYFSVQSIEIKGIKDLSREEVEKATFDALDRGAWKPWDRRNWLFVNVGQVASSVQQTLFAENVIVDKVYPNVLRLMITERQRRVVYVRDGQDLTIDTDGLITDGQVDTAYIQNRIAGKALADATHPVIVVQTAPVMASTSTIQLFETTSTPQVATTTQQLTDDVTVKHWLDSSEALIASGIKFKVLEVIEPNARSFNVVTDKGYRITMDLLSPLEPQIETYLKFMQTKTKDMVINEYIDVRAPGKVYFK